MATTITTTEAQAIIDAQYDTLVAYGEARERLEGAQTALRNVLADGKAREIEALRDYCHAAVALWTERVAATKAAWMAAEARWTAIGSPLDVEELAA